MFKLLKQVFIALLKFSGSLTSFVNTLGHTIFISLNNRQCVNQLTLINLHPNEYFEGLRYYPFAVNLDRCIRSCNTLNDLSNKLCVPSKTEELVLSVFNKITGINELKILTKHISCECKSQFDGSKCNLNQKWNNTKCRCESKNLKEHYARKKDYIWNSATCTCKNGEYLASSIDDSVITCDEVINNAESV